MKSNTQKQSYPSGQQCVWNIFPHSLLFTPPHQGPTDLKGPLLPGYKRHLNQRTGTPAKAGKGEECMTIKSPNMWHWIQQIMFSFFIFLKKWFINNKEKFKGQNIELSDTLNHSFLLLGTRIIYTKRRVGLNIIACTFSYVFLLSY